MFGFVLDTLPSSAYDRRVWAFDAIIAVVDLLMIALAAMLTQQWRRRQAREQSPLRRQAGTRKSLLRTGRVIGADWPQPIQAVSRLHERATW